MDVQCERCHTKYDFDDALLTSRGTKVRCTQCGFLFRLEAKNSGDDRWIVDVKKGWTLQFASIRELQKAVQDGTVTLDDRIRRNEESGRRLGDIPELVALFSQSKSGKSPSTPPPPPGREKLPSIRPNLTPSAPPAAVVGTASVEGSLEEAAITLRRSALNDAESVPPPKVSAPIDPRLLPSVPSVPIAGASGDAGPGASEARPPWTVRPSAVDDLGAPRSRARGWLVAGVIGIAVIGAGALVARQYAKPSEPPVEKRNVNSDILPQVEAKLRAGDVAAASSLASDLRKQDPGDPAAALAVARVASILADESWLDRKARGGASEVDTKLTYANEASRDAATKNEASPPALRIRVDVLRMLGEFAAARALLSKLDASEVETEYTLAALDLAENGVWSTQVTDRLRRAAAAEGSLCRARGLLVYGLATHGSTHGQGDEARREFDRLMAMRRDHAASDSLRALLGPAMDASVPDASFVDASASDGGAVLSSREASRALAKRDFLGARAAYEAMVARNPNDPDALTGLGNVKRATGDSAGAIGSYKRALAANPSYLPAMIALADTYWSSGQQGEAMHIYREIVDRFPPATYPSHVKTRVEGAATVSPSAAPSAQPPPSAAPPSARPSPSSTPVSPTLSTGEE